MNVVSFVTGKGGAGKTTMAITLGTGLMLMGNSVLFIETDPQRSIATLWLLQQSGEVQELYSVAYSDGSDLEDLIALGRENGYEWCIIDGYPSHKAEDLAVYAQIIAQSNIVVVVLGNCMLDYHAAMPTIEIAKELESANRTGRVIRGLQTRVDPRLAKPGFIDDAAKELGIEIMNTVIGSRASFVRRSNVGETVFDEKTSASSYKDAIGFVNEIISLTEGVS